VKRVFVAALTLWCAGSALAAATVVLPPSPAFEIISPRDLRDRYDVVWAVSDLHGHLEQLEQLLLGAGLAVRGQGGQLGWTPGKARQLFVVVGDCIDDGPDSYGVVMRLEALQTQAAAAGSRVLVLLGNHEVDFLYKPKSASGDLVSSAESAGIKLSRKHRGERLAQSEFGEYLRQMPVAAIVGSWMFAHAGYLDADDDDRALSDYFVRIAASWPGSDQERYKPLKDGQSILEFHGWWKRSKRMSRMKEHLARLGLEGLVFGHDPDAFGAQGMIAQRGGWLIKLDTGLKTSRSRGMFLRCEVAQGIGTSTCRSMSADGALHELPAK